MMAQTEGILIPQATALFSRKLDQMKVFQQVGSLDSHTEEEKEDIRSRLPFPAFVQR
jgi:hypothetical protein